MTKRSGRSVRQAKPTDSYLKWAGGKGRTMRHLLACFPARIEDYNDHTCGGLAPFLHLADAGRLVGKITLSDAMPELIDLHTIVRANPSLVAAVKEWPHDQQSYLKIRDRVTDNRQFRALRIFYVNRRGFNGLIRHSREGEINTTWGGGEHVQKYPKNMVERLANVQSLLQRLQVSLVTRSVFEADPARGSFNYVDPPYIPLDGRPSFTDYSLPFGDEQQYQLMRLTREWSKRCTVFVSNSDSTLTRQLYAGCLVKEINAPRTIGVATGSRGEGHAKELLIMVRP